VNLKARGGGTTAFGGVEDTLSDLTQNAPELWYPTLHRNISEKDDWE